VQHFSKDNIIDNLTKLLQCLNDLGITGSVTIIREISSGQIPVNVFGPYGKVGTTLWFEDGVLHREDGPAIEYPNGSDADGPYGEWFHHGKRHRADFLPAINTAKMKQYWSNGNLKQTAVFQPCNVDGCECHEDVRFPQDPESNFNKIWSCTNCNHIHRPFTRSLP